MIKKFKKNLKYIIMSIPALMILILPAISSLNILEHEKAKFLFLLSLLIIYPVIFFYLGYISFKREENIFLLSLPSYIAFGAVFYLWLNNTASDYIFVYIAAEALGYGLGIFKKNNAAKLLEKERKEKFYAGKK